MKSKTEEFFDSLAPNWDEGETRSVAEKRAIVSKVGIQSGQRVLDLACGTGVITGILHEFSQAPILGIDLSGEMITRAKKKYKGCDWASFEKADFLSARIDEPFDVIVCYNAFPHFLDVDAFASKLSRCVKKGGRVALLHSLSRKELSLHHSGAASCVSRVLGSPEEEARSFLGFTPLFGEEGEHRYILLLEKD